MRKSARTRLARKRRQSFRNFLDDDEPPFDEREPFDEGGPLKETDTLAK